MKRYLVSQFGQPRGIVGWLAGVAMAIKNRERNDWMVDLLDIRATDRVLEIGFGPGVTIARIAQLTRSGFVAGIDRSKLMVQQARGSNADLIALGRVDLRQGAGPVLPFRDLSFDKACASNVNFFWEDPHAHLIELKRVLRTGGMLAIALQPRWAKSEAEIQSVGEKLASQFSAAGFRDVTLESKPMRPVTALCMLGRK